MRVLVTGSRNWEGPWAEGSVNWALSSIYRLLTLANEPMILVHGHCPTGADQLADDWAIGQDGVTVERHPADWTRYGKAAGPRRNKEMVDLGADICIGFKRGSSLGTAYTLDLARNAGILTIEITWPFAEE